MSKRTINKKMMTRFKIVGATLTAIFSLFSVFAGTAAWFSTNTSVSVSGGMFTVRAIDASIESVTLYKFNYADDGFGGYDYLFPENGWVGSYLYDDRVGRQSFGEVVHNDETDEDEWQSVTMMNLYDPLDSTITGRGLISLNCNAVFKIVLTSSTLINTSIPISIKAQSVQSEKSKRPNDIWLSTCVDFDFFLPSALSDPRLVTDGYKNYLPSESDSYLPQNTVFDHQYEEDYYKISYLASLNDEHSHFYGSSDLFVNIATENITFVDGHTTLYVNMNYAPSQLVNYESISVDETVRAVYDFLLEIS